MKVLVLKKRLDYITVKQPSELKL